MKRLCAYCESPFITNLPASKHQFCSFQCKRQKWREDRRIQRYSEAPTVRPGMRALARMSLPMAKLPPGALPLGLQREIADPEDVPDLRRVNCAHMSACVGYSACQGWESFACGKACTAYQPMTPDEHRRDLEGLAWFLSRIAGAS